MEINLKELEHIKFALLKAKKDNLPQEISKEYNDLYNKISILVDQELKRVRIKFLTANSYKD